MDMGIKHWRLQQLDLEATVMCWLVKYVCKARLKYCGQLAVLLIRLPSCKLGV